MKTTQTEKLPDTRKNDLLLTGLFVLSAAVFIGIASFCGKGGQILLITLDGEEVVREPLETGKTYRITAGDGEYNLISVETDAEGRPGIRCSESSCPEQICVEKGLVTLSEDPIVCLPHRMTARIVSR